MRLDIQQIKKSALVSKSTSYVKVITYFCLILTLHSCKKIPPPELRRCTRIEIQYYPSTLEHLYTAQEQALLIPEEKQYLQSLKTIVVDDPRLIKEFSNDINSGRYNGTGTVLSKLPIADVFCYSNSECLTSFADYYTDILDKEGRWFLYKNRKISLMKLTPQVKPFSLRVRCARHLSDCHTSLRLFFDNKGKKYLPSKWCDVIVSVYRNAKISKNEIMRSFKCPGANEGKCHYALNPHCEPNSPPDMVHLFESKAGWNQHGGPELFTFDNHDPKGGCVLLNDGTVKFIRRKKNYSNFDGNRDT